MFLGVSHSYLRNMEDLPKLHRYFGVECNNRTWDYIQKEQRTLAETQEMIHCAHSAKWHWSMFPNHHSYNLTRGDFTIALAYLVADMPSQALEYAWLCYNRTQEFLEEMQDFDITYAHAILAKSLELNNQPEAANEHRTAAERSRLDIKDPEDKKIVDGDWERFFA